MPIDRETFENSSESELEELSVPDRVLGFLVVHDDRAFNVSELADRLGASNGTVSTALSRLKERGLVEHKATYWAITTDQNRLESYKGYARATELFTEQLGAEDKDRWQGHAPDGPHPNTDSG